MKVATALPVLKAADTPSPDVVLHLVGRVTDAVFSFLGPLTAALAEQGAQQTIVLIDDPRHRHLLPHFHESVRLVLTDADGPRSHRMAQLLDAYCDAAAARRPSVAHLHGIVCSLLGQYASRVRGVSVPTYFSPHGSKLIGPLRRLGFPVLWFLRPFSGSAGQRVIASNRADAQALGPMVSRSIDVIESPVNSAFFEAESQPADAPRIVTCSRAVNPVGAALVAQCAVLLSDQVPGLDLQWIGGADAESVARMAAAKVRLIDATDEHERVRLLSSAWVYLAPPGHSGFPVFLAEAMALGLPCVAWDTPHHRDVIQHGRTGFLCADTQSALDHLAALIDSPALRRDMGDAARQAARERFDGSRFRESLVGLYGAWPRA